MKLTNTLGCADKPCDCGCSDCNDNKPKTPSASKQAFPLVQSVQSGYRKLSPEDYLPYDLEVKKPESSGYNKKGESVRPSGFNKKKIVKSDNAPEIIVTEKNSLAKKDDNTGVIIAGLGMGLFLLALISRRKNNDS